VNDSKYNLACDYYYDEKYEKSFTLFLELANKNDVESQAMIANMLLHGIGTSKNEKKAYEWYKKAAENNAPESQYWLGTYMLKQNHIKDGISWLDKAANNNFTIALHDLGCYYYNGKYVNQNTEKSIFYLKKALMEGRKEAFSDFFNALAFKNGKLYALYKSFIISIQIFMKKEKKGSCN